MSEKALPEHVFPIVGDREHRYVQCIVTPFEDTGIATVFVDGISEYITIFVCATQKPIPPEDLAKVITHPEAKVLVILCQDNALVPLELQAAERVDYVNEPTEVLVRVSQLV